MQKYPVGIQSFSEIIERGFLYIDKTEQIYNLTQEGKFFFLARPRRFGKSLIVSTLHHLFSANAQLFKGLWIENKWDWTKKNPVIYIPFNGLSFHDLGLEATLFSDLTEQIKRQSFEVSASNAAELFKKFIKTAYEKTGRKVVVLIDEYDKALVDYLDNQPRFEEHRTFLKAFYGVLKPSDDYLEFVFLTGITQFGKVSIFSDLNNLRDITNVEEFGTIAGITQQELENHFSEEIDAFAQKRSVSRDAFLAKIKQWYNGYSWDLVGKVYNPFSLLNFFADKGTFRNYWFNSGAPFFLTKELQKHSVYDISQIKVTSSTLSTFDPFRMNTTVLLYQTGYLTLVDYNEEDGLYTLDYPNFEVRDALAQFLIAEYREDNNSAVPTVVDFRNALRNNDLDEAMRQINIIFSTLPYEHWEAKKETFYHALIHLTFVLLGAYIQCEIHTSNGRCDAIVHTDKYIYAFEFKLDKTAKVALQQIEDRGYLTPHLASPKTKIAVGVGFSSKTKKVKSYLAKEINS